MNAPLAQPRVHWDDFELDPGRRTLWRRGVRIRLQRVPFQVLTILLERPGEIVPREEFHKRIWNGYSYGDFDHSLNIAVNKLRVALRDSARDPRYIETVSQVGYRFLGSVESRVPEPAVEATAPLGRRSLAIPVLVALLLSAAMLLAWQWSRQDAVPAVPSGRVMVAVLPLENLTGDPAQDYFSDGMTEELITELGRLGTPRLGVIARSSVMAYKGTRKPVKDVGHELGVDYVIEGSLRQEGERVRITIHLIRVADATQVWAESYERNLASVLSVQQSVARNVADLVRIELPPDAQRHLAEVRRVNPEAYKLYLRGRHAWRQRTPADVRKALEYFEHAVALDPGFALAYVGIADCYTLEGGSYLGAPPRKARAFAIQAVRKALALDDSLAEAHATLAESLYYGEWDWAGAEREFRRALELNPNYPTAHQWYSEFLSMAGRHDQAIAEMKLARTLDPHSSIIHASLGWSYYHARRYDDAIRECQQVLSVTPDLGTAQVCLSVALYDSGRHRQAFEETLKHNGLQSDLELRKQWQAAYERGGWPAVWAQTWDRMSKQKAIGEEVEFYDLAEVALRLDRHDEALRLLEQAAEQREENLVQIRAYAAFYPLENDPRFHQLLARVNFPER